MYRNIAISVIFYRYFPAFLLVWFEVAFDNLFQLLQCIFGFECKWLPYEAVPQNNSGNSQCVQIIVSTFHKNSFPYNACFILQ